VTEPAIEDEVTIVDYVVDTLYARTAPLAVMAGGLAAVQWGAALASQYLPADWPAGWLIAPAVSGLVSWLVFGALSDQVLSRIVGVAASAGESLARALAMTPMLALLLVCVNLPAAVIAAVAFWIRGGDFAPVSGLESWLPIAMATLWNAAGLAMLGMAPAVALVERRSLAGSLAGSLAIARRYPWAVAQLTLAVVLGGMVAIGIGSFLFSLARNIADLAGLPAPISDLIGALGSAVVFCIFAMAWPAGYLKLRQRGSDPVEAGVADTFD